ncbi:MAG: AarF/ABC1/UbiB kinase family protein [Actinobacteria bacterium]|nr:AarF/ABC1/UbiB kinase family protein [Actinomycetota bacterium]MCB8997928.1 AarF/ABC1/UbiB kinase family protein [Actinomycetota bacterium]MCB9414475.1 AarF/ABC1/UbiB kinase family protein [Actinomycetota bacterium]HRY08735.1 AarF/ABC1/UbiB kinase family protein [Candidatus Nanopelagicales bacterium]
MALSRSALWRSSAIGLLPLRALGRSARVQWGVLRGGDRTDLSNAARSATADDTRRVLGELKGGALKAGQLLSTVETLFPQDPDGSWRAALTAMQEDNPGLPLAEMEDVLREDLGPRWRSDFADFDEHPVAAASIGQVHSAVLADGTAVAVKIQYPGIAEAMAADVRALSIALRATSIVARGMAMPPLVAELRTRLSEELDYEREAHSQNLFADAYCDDDEVVVPRVLRATKRVMISQWLPGTGFAQIALDGAQAQRDRAGQLYQRFFLVSPGRVGLLHTDPHPGNFRMVGDRLGVLDFGSVLHTPGGLPETFGRLIAGMLAGDTAAVERRLREDGFIKPGKHLEVDKLADYLAPFTEPARHETFAYSREWLRGTFGKVNDPRNPDFAVALQMNMPAEQLFTHRVWLGLVGVLSGLNARVAVRSELERFLPGFALGKNTPPE